MLVLTRFPRCVSYSPIVCTINPETDAGNDRVGIRRGCKTYLEEDSWRERRKIPLAAAKSQV
jgi:hypothetical protein